jgi:hypothetical protein
LQHSRLHKLNLEKIKSDPKVAQNDDMVEHLQKSSPLLLAELDRWEEIIGDDYLHYKYETERDKDRLRVTLTNT